MSGRARTYLVLAIVGFITPYALLAIFVGEHGIDVGALDSTVASISFADLMLSGVAFWVWMWGEAPRVGVSPWPFVAGTLLVGVCFAPPLFLYVRERRAAAGGGAAPPA